MVNQAVATKTSIRLDSKETIKKKRALMIIAYKDFRDEEYFIPRQVLEINDIDVITCSSQKGKAIGSYGGEVVIDLTLEEVNLEEIDIVIFVGGAGAADYLENKKCWEIARETLKQKKILGAICIAPAILARAGILKSKKATIWSSPMDKSAIKILKEEGAHYQEENVVQDGNIVTADGPQSARQFGETIAHIANNNY
jgi:protease I